MGAFAGASSSLLHLHGAVARARNGAPDQQQVALGVDLDDLEPRWVTRLPPIRPGILTPLKTRAGSALAPIEPGARTLCEPWVTGPRLKLWRWIVPWKPLPIAIPETLTRWPGSNCSTVSTLADLVLAGLVAELDQRPRGPRAGLLQVARARPW